MPLICIVRVVNGNKMSVQEQAAPVSTKTLTNRPPRLARILIRLPLEMMFPTSGEASHPYCESEYLAAKAAKPS